MPEMNDKYADNTLRNISEGNVNSLLNNKKENGQDKFVIADKEKIVKNDENFKSFIEQLKTEKSELGKKLEGNYKTANDRMAKLGESAKNLELTLDKESVKGPAIQEVLNSYKNAVDGLQKSLGKGIESSDSLTKSDKDKNLGDNFKNFAGVTKSETIATLERNASEIQKHAETISALENKIKEFAKKIPEKTAETSVEKDKPRRIPRFENTFYPEKPDLSQVGTPEGAKFSLQDGDGKDKTLTEKLTTLEKQAIGKDILPNGARLEIRAEKTAEEARPEVALLYDPTDQITYSITQEIIDKEGTVGIVVRSKKGEVKTASDKTTDKKNENAQKRKIFPDKWSAEISGKVNEGDKVASNWGIKAGDIFGVEETGVDFNKDTSDYAKVEEYLSQRTFDVWNKGDKPTDSWKVSSEKNVNGEQIMSEKGDELRKNYKDEPAKMKELAKDIFTKNGKISAMNIRGDKAVAVLRVQPGTKTYQLNFNDAQRAEKMSIAAKDPTSPSKAKLDRDMRTMLQISGDKEMYYAKSGDSMYIRVVDKVVKAPVSTLNTSVENNEIKDKGKIFDQWLDNPSDPKNIMSLEKQLGIKTNSLGVSGRFLMIDTDDGLHLQVTKEGFIKSADSDMKNIIKRHQSLVTNVGHTLTASSTLNPEGGSYNYTAVNNGHQLLFDPTKNMQIIALHVSDTDGKIVSYPKVPSLKEAEKILKMPKIPFKKENVEKLGEQKVYTMNIEEKNIRFINVDLPHDHHQYLLDASNQRVAELLWENNQIGGKLIWKEIKKNTNKP